MAVAPHRSIKSAERTLALFELFSREQQPFTVGRVAKGLGIPQPSVSMLLRNLREMGYLEYDPLTRTFAPSIRVALLGSWIDQRFGAAGAIGARLRALHSQVGHNAFIGIQNGAAAQYVIGLGESAPGRLDVTSGGYRSLTFSAVGRALLSLLPDNEVMSWARRCNAEAESDRWRVNANDFLALIRDVRAKGYAMTCGDVTPGMAAIATTFTSPLSRSPLAIGVGGPIAKIHADEASIVEALRAFSTETQAALDPPLHRAA
jgi:IclR family KDG regulon transcriptional repressor